MRYLGENRENRQSRIRRSWEKRVRDEITYSSLPVSQTSINLKTLGCSINFIITISFSIPNKTYLRSHSHQLSLFTSLSTEREGLTLAVFSCWVLLGFGMILTAAYWPVCLCFANLTLPNTLSPTISSDSSSYERREKTLPDEPSPTVLPILQGPTLVTSASGFLVELAPPCPPDLPSFSLRCWRVWGSWGGPLWGGEGRVARGWDGADISFGTRFSIECVESIRLR